jgi:hypothetical protein
MAVTTTAHACTTASWTDLGAGPMTVQTVGLGCLVQIADSDPSSSKIGFHLGDRIFTYTGSSHLWAYGTGYIIVGK